MPIYAYRCDECGAEKDVLQKFSDAPLTRCTTCGLEAFRRVLTAPAFQLKGSGWYVTDFRDGGKKPADAVAPKAAGANGSAEAAKDAPAPAPGAPSRRDAPGTDAKPAAGASQATAAGASPPSPTSGNSTS